MIDTAPGGSDRRITSTRRRWHSRAYLPHIDGAHLVQSISFRLSDSVPQALIRAWRVELGVSRGTSGDDSRSALLRDRIERFEDSGHGACHLRDPRIASIVETSLLHFDGERYLLLEWCVMPNHVHALAETLPGHSVGSIIRSWKTFSGRAANRILGKTGEFWMRDYFDRYVRDERHFAAARGYIRENPVAAGLCRHADEWRWSSAWEGTRGKK